MTRARLALALAAVATALPVALARPQVASAIPPPDKRVYVVSESVGLGAKSALPKAFPADWQITVDGTPALFVEQLESKHVRARMATSPSVFGDYAVVAGGHNYPYWDPKRFDDSIDSIIAALEQAGSKHIFWVTLREVKPQYISASAWIQVQPYSWYFPTVNAHLREALKRHPNLTLIDWAAIADRPGLTYDAIHLNSYGAAEYSALVARTVMAVATRLEAGSEQAIDVTAAGAPAGTTAVALNLTVTGPRDTGYVTAYPCGGARPEVSSLNYGRDQTVAAAAIVPVADDGTVCAYTSEATQLIVDATGWFAGEGFQRAGPARVADTRSGARQTGGAPLVVPLASMPGVPADAAAVVLDVTATDASADGFVTVYGCGTAPPPTSNVNVRAAGTAPNEVVVAPGPAGEICVVPSVDMHLLVDVFGWLDDAADVELPAPARAFDSRVTGVVVDGGETVRVPVPSPAVPAPVPVEPGGGTGATSGDPVAGVAVGAADGAGAAPAEGAPITTVDGPRGALVNLTATGSTGEGYLTAYPCDTPQPGSSNLNTVVGRDVANFAVVGAGPTGEVCVFVSTATHVVVDVLGSVGPAFSGITPVRLFDSRTAAPAG